MIKKIFILITFLINTAFAKEIVININAISIRGIGEQIGTIKLEDSQGYVVLTTSLVNLPQGERGFHIHEKPSCASAMDEKGITRAGLAAGGHYDPSKTESHRGPNKQGHLGDLYALVVEEDNTANVVMELMHIKSVDQLLNRSIIIHAGGDNYSDKPEPLGGGGHRIACGVINE